MARATANFLVISKNVGTAENSSTELCSQLSDEMQKLNFSKDKRVTLQGSTEEVSRVFLFVFSSAAFLWKMTRKLVLDKFYKIRDYQTIEKTRKITRLKPAPNWIDFYEAQKQNRLSI